MRKLQNTKKNAKLYKSKKNRSKFSNLRKHKKTYRFKKSYKKIRGGNSLAFAEYAQNPINLNDLPSANGVSQVHVNSIEFSRTGGTIDPPISSTIYGGNYKSRKSRKSRKSKKGGGFINPFRSIPSLVGDTMYNINGPPNPQVSANPWIQPAIDETYNSRYVL